MCIEPLHVDERIEAHERARIGHALARWLQRLFPALTYHGPPRARRSIESQLLKRPDFSPELWSECGPPAEIEAILKIIRKELALPKHNFIPDDPVVLLMGCGRDIDDVYALLELEEKYAVTFQDEELERIRQEEWTLGQFVKDLLARRAGTTSTYQSVLEDRRMGLPRMTTRWWIIVIAIVAVLLALPSLVSVPCATVAALILLPAAMAPRRWRVEVAYWAAGLHPLTILGWLAVWRFWLDPMGDYGPGAWCCGFAFEFPEFLAFLSRWYLPFLLLVGGVLAAGRFSGRHVIIPLLVLTVVWLLTWVVVDRDLLQLISYEMRY